MHSVNPYESPATIIGPAEAAPTNVDGLPWESEGCGAASWVKTGWLVTTAPSAAFARMRPAEMFPLALTYLIVGGALSGIVLFGRGAIAYLFVVIEYPEVPVVRIVGHLIGLLLGHVLQTSLFAVLVTLIMAAIQHGVLKLMDGVTRSFATTFRTAAYATGSIAFLLAIPVIGYLAILLLLNANMRGLKQSQQCLEAKALLATIVSIPVGVGVVIIRFVGF